jgi:hypothetical protein
MKNKALAIKSILEMTGTRSRSAKSPGTPIPDTVSADYLSW